MGKFYLLSHGQFETICEILESQALSKKNRELYYNLWKMMLECPHTKRRLKEMKIFPKAQSITEEMRRNGVERSHISIWKYIASLSNNEVTCSGCGKYEEEDRRFQKCSRCKLAFFCSKTCFKKNWKDHKARCKSVA